MDPIKTESTYNTPSVDFNADTGELTIEGRSIPEHANVFFHPIVDWVKEYVAQNPPTTVFNIKLDYLNSSSHKFLREILEKLEPLNASSNITIKWYYEEDDEEMRETGEEYEESIDLPFEYIAVEEI